MTKRLVGNFVARIFLSRLRPRPLPLPPSPRAPVRTFNGARATGGTRTVPQGNGKREMTARWDGRKRNFHEDERNPSRTNLDSRIGNGRDLKESKEGRRTRNLSKRDG